MEPESPILRPFRAADIPDALRLKDLAGWNQVAADWQLFLEIAPGGAFALEKGGRVIATSTAVPYGRAFGWIGMMLVDPEERRKGHGARMLEAAIAFLVDRGCLPALDATAMGKPLYERFGFRDLFPVERWIGPAPPGTPADPAARPLDPASIDAVLPLDLERFGADRRDVLAGLLGRPGAAGFVIEEAGAGGVEGFIIGRPGSRFTHIGPWIARSADAARRLLAAALAAGAGPGRPVGIDIPAPNEAARAIARAAGLEPARVLWRMVRSPGGEPPPARRPSDGEIPPGGRPDRIHGLAGLEWG
jgi:GNAT superfamily N-acetyltransferase